jgi:predicted GNAT superfamily acetyltransferase
MESSYKERMGGLANRLKSEQPKTPIQEVKPVAIKAIKEIARAETAQLNVWIPKDLVKRIKSYGIEKELSLKEITTLALEAYLKETVHSS